VASTAATLISVLPGPATAQGRAPHADAGQSHWFAVSAPSRKVVVASQESGVIDTLAVVEGQRVHAGEVLFRMDASVLEAKVARLRLLAASDVRLRAARHQLRQTTREVGRLRQLREQDAVSTSDAEAAEFQLALAEIAVDRAVLEQASAAAALEEAERQLARLTVVSPLNGVVERCRRQQGEAVERLEPILEVVDADVLWIEFDCPLEQVDRLPLGTRLSVHPVTGSHESRTGTVIHRSFSADAASQSRRVRLAVANESNTWHPGYKMVVTLPASVPAAESAPPTPK